MTGCLACAESGIFSPTGRLRGQRPQRQKIRIRNHHPGGQAATVAGHVGPGFHTWPSGHILQPRIRNYFFASGHLLKKTFGETFGEARAATVDSGIFSTTGRLRGQRPQRQKIRIRNHHPGGQAATVAGHVGPGFHTWPSGHISQNTDPKLLLRIRSPAQKNRSARRSVRRTPRPSIPVSFQRPGGSGVSDPSDRKSESETTIQAAKPPL
jgi:hypothetical protein